MTTGTDCGIRGLGIAALLVSLAMGVTGVASATAGSAAAPATPIGASSQALDLGHNVRNGSTAGYAAYVASLRLSAGRTHQHNKSCNWCTSSGGVFRIKGNPARSAARALPTSVAMSVPASFEFATLTAAPSGSDSSDSPADVSEILATNIVFLSDRNVTPVRFVGAVISRLETGMNWRSNAFSIAGSRIWSKVIKFSSTGVNVRLPLN